MNDLPTDRESSERLRKTAASHDLSLEQAYLETRAALSEVRQLYFKRVSTEAAEFVRLEAVERRMDALEAQMMQVLVALSQKRSLYRRIVWLLFGKH